MIIFKVKWQMDGNPRPEAMEKFFVKEGGAIEFGDKLKKQAANLCARFLSEPVITKIECDEGVIKQ